MLTTEDLRIADDAPIEEVIDYCGYEPTSCPRFGFCVQQIETGIACPRGENGYRDDNCLRKKYRMKNGRVLDMREWK